MEDRDGHVSGTAVPSTTLDWNAFSAAYFPGRRRHDFAALTAYASHRRVRRVPGADRVEPAGGGAGEALSLAARADVGKPEPVRSKRSPLAV